MSVKSIAVAVVLALIVVAGIFAATPRQGSTTVETADDTVAREKTEALIRDYILANPEIIIQAVNRYEARQRRAATSDRRALVADNRDAIFNEVSSPVGGNPEGDVTIVEFFDYQCGYCKAVYPRLMALLKEDRGVRFVYKEFPILGEVSVYAARVALATRVQGKYEVFHHAMMRLQGRLTIAKVNAVAAKTGLDMARLRADVKAPEIDAMLRRNFDLASALNINGTPAFVIGKELIPGAVSLDQLKALVARARKSS